METKLPVDRAEGIANRLLFDDRILVSALNYGGGIWVLWNGSQVNLSHIQISSRSVHAIVTLNQGVPPFLMSAVYNFPQPHLQS